MPPADVAVMEEMVRGGDGGNIHIQVYGDPVSGACLTLFSVPIHWWTGWRRWTSRCPRAYWIWWSSRLRRPGGSGGSAGSAQYGKSEHLDLLELLVDPVDKWDYDTVLVAMDTMVLLVGLVN